MEFEKKDWRKVAKAFATQAYGKKKLEEMRRERCLASWSPADELRAVVNLRPIF